MFWLHNSGWLRRQKTTRFWRRGPRRSCCCNLGHDPQIMRFGWHKMPKEAGNPCEPKLQVCTFSIPLPSLPCLQPLPSTPHTLQLSFSIANDQRQDLNKSPSYFLCSQTCRQQHPGLRHSPRLLPPTVKWISLSDVWNLSKRKLQNNR